MFDYEISYALECVPATERKRLTCILIDLEPLDRDRVCEMVRHDVSRFNHYRLETPGSAGQVAYDSLVRAIKIVRTDELCK